MRLSTSSRRFTARWPFHVFRSEQTCFQRRRRRLNDIRRGSSGPGCESSRTNLFGRRWMASVFLSGGSVSFFARVGFAHVFARFCFAIKSGPLFVISVRVRVNPHESRPACVLRASRFLLPQAWGALRGLPSVWEWVSRWAKGRPLLLQPVKRRPLLLQLGEGDSGRVGD